MLVAAISLIKYTALNYLFTLFFMAPVNIFGTIFGKILPQNDDLYMDNIVLARKIRGVMKDEVC